MHSYITILQGILAVIFLTSGFSKGLIPKAKLELKMPWAQDFSQSAIYLAAISEILGAIGLILPEGLNILPILTPIAAIGLIMIMVLAAMTHYKRKEKREIGVNVGLSFFLLIIVVYHLL